jgi:hypothetical protein
MNKESENKCSGCKLKHKGNFYECMMSNHIKNSELSCPCQTCLLKGLCNFYCKPFIDFIHPLIIDKCNDPERLDGKFLSAYSIKPTTKREDVLVFLQYYYRFYLNNRYKEGIIELIRKNPLYLFSKS